MHALVAMTTKSFPVQPALPATSDGHGADEVMPITSYLCQWKVPKKRKESNMPMSTAVFEKHDYRKQKKRKVTLTEEFDPRSVEFRGTAPSLLPALLDSVRGESLGVSVLFDSAHCHKSLSHGSPDPPTLSAIKQTVVAFKETLRMPAKKL